LERERSPDVISPEIETADLYEVVQKLLDQRCNAVEQQKALQSFHRIMKSPSEPPLTWSGPGAPLSAVVKAGRSDLARVLLRARADPNQRDSKGVGALHLATFDGNYELCRVLLVARADVDACDRHGQTPLFFAPTKELCKLLVERRSDVTVLNRKGQSALHLAGRAGLHEVLEWFATRVSKSLVELRDVHGATAKNYVQQSGVPKPEHVNASPRGSPRQSPRASRGRLETRLPPQVPPRKPALPTSQISTSQPWVPSEPVTPVADADAKRKASAGQLPYISELVAEERQMPAAIHEAPRNGQVVDNKAKVSTRVVEHFEISDGMESELEQRGSEPSLPAPSCEEMFDSLDVGIAKKHDSELLAAAVGLATAAVATAAATASVPGVRHEEQLESAKLHQEEIARAEEEEELGAEDDGDEEEEGESEGEEDEVEEDEEEEEEDQEQDEVADVCQDSNAQQGLDELGIEDDDEEGNSASVIGGGPLPHGATVNAYDLAELGILDSVDDAEVEFLAPGPRLGKIEDELDDEVF